jgi:hypothetical protein
LRTAATVRPTTVDPGRSAAPPAALLEDAVEGLARTRLGEVVQLERPRADGSLRALV